MYVSTFRQRFRNQAAAAETPVVRMRGDDDDSAIPCQVVDRRQRQCIHRCKVISCPKHHGHTESEARPKK
jgi:hypothetical protein